MTTYIYPSQEWSAASAEGYDHGFEEKLKNLTGKFSFNIMADPALGIESDLYFFLEIEAGKLQDFAPRTKDFVHENAKFVMNATFATWKEILTEKATFTKKFLLGKIKLEKGSKVGVMGIAPHSATLVKFQNQVDLKYPDDLSDDEVAAYRTKLADDRQAGGY
jgi:putative sterol carrier protein